MRPTTPHAPPLLPHLQERETVALAEARLVELEAQAAERAAAQEAAQAALEAARAEASRAAQAVEAASAEAKKVAGGEVGACPSTRDASDE